MSLTVGTTALVGNYLWNKDNVPHGTTTPVHCLSLFGGSKGGGCQDSVFSETKQHALYLTIYLSTHADPKECARIVAKNLKKNVDTVVPADLRDDDTEILAGVGFSEEMVHRLGGAVRPPHQFAYKERHSPLGSMPATGGDMFIHAKCDNQGSLFELAERVLQDLPKGSVARIEDTYGFVYRNGRDLSGFIDGTENPADEESRNQLAVNKASGGGSFAIAQRWVHNHDAIRVQKDSQLSEWIGRRREDSVELESKATTAHVARMTGGTNVEQKKVHEIVRQSQPYGHLSGESGLFFIAYSAQPIAFDYMLDRMTGRGEKDEHCDNVMRMTRCVTGNYFYFPSHTELAKI
jgi:putative iron-dependent peroxidase